MRAMWRASCAETRLRRVLPPRDWRIVRHRCEAIADRMPPSDRSAASRFEHGGMDECAKGADALLDGPLRETLRLARIGAWVEANHPQAYIARRDTPIRCDAHIMVIVVRDYRTAALAAGAPAESPQGDPT